MSQQPTFSVNAEGLDGETFEMLDTDAMTFAEAAALEKVTGHSLGDILDKQTGIYKFSDVTAGFTWLSVKRHRPALSFSQWRELPMGAVVWHEPDAEPEPDDADTAAAAEPDPTGGGHPAAPPSSGPA